MTHHSTSRAGTGRRWGARSLLAAMLLSLLLPGVAAAGNGAVAVSGTQLAYGTCDVGYGPGYEMTGDLVGCWTILTFDSNTDESKHNMRATGTERFDGWIGSLQGSFTTTFQYTAKMDGSWVNFLEIHGRCHHPIVADSGEGDFVGITGELSFKDVVDVVPNYYPYWGNVRIGGQTLALSQVATTTASRSATSSVSSPC
jgi:hypothetical protein